MDSSATATSQPGARIHPATSMGAVTLRVSNLARAQEFYERVLGLGASDGEDGTVELGAGGGAPIVRLRGDSSAPRLDRNAPGLFHLAILMPDRRALAMTLARLHRVGWPLDGASDHLVSEALYLSDPVGNGIEIYRDRPRHEWHYDDGQLAMATLPLDFEGLLGELPGREDIGRAAPPEARIGHVHLQVSDLGSSEDFYAGVLGFDVVVRGYPGALFVSAGGYHHHLGLNTWHTRGGNSRPAGSVGLEHFEIVVPDVMELERMAARLEAASVEVDVRRDSCLTTDPSGNRVLLRSA